MLQSRTEAFVRKCEVYPDEWKQTVMFERFFERKELKVPLPSQLVRFPPSPLRDTVIVRLSVLVNELGFPDYPIVEKTSSPEDLTAIQNWLHQVRLDPARVVGNVVAVVWTYDIKLIPGRPFSAP